MTETEPSLSGQVAAIGSAWSTRFELFQERLIHGFLERDPLTGVVSQHQGYQLEHLIPILVPSRFTWNITCQLLTLSPHVSSAGTFFVPLQLPLGEVF